MGRIRDRAYIQAVYSKRADRYLELVRAFPLRPLRNDTDLDAAVAMIDALIDLEELSSPEQDYLDVLSDLVETYEEQTIPIESVSDAKMLQSCIEAKGVTQAEVAKRTRIAESTISEVLSGKRKLNRAQIGKLARYFKVSPAAFAFGA